MIPEIKAICFPVMKIPTIELMKNPLMKFNSENSFAIVATLPTNEEKTLNICSDVYKLVENSAILEPLIPVLETKFKSLDVTVKSTNDAQFFVKVAPTKPSFGTGNEVILPAISFVNSYDGKIKAQAIGGLVRYLVDDKGKVSMVFSTYLKGLSFVYEFKHSNSDIYSMTEVANHIDLYILTFPDVLQQIDLLKQVDVKKATSAKIEKLVRKISMGTQFPLKSIPETVERVIYEMDVFECNLNLWMLYTSMNFVLETSEATLSQKLRMETDNKIFANIQQLIPVKKTI